MSRSIGGYLNDLLDGKKSKQETVTLLQKQREKFAAKKVKEAREELLLELKGELAFHTISENTDQMSKQYVMNTLDFKIKSNKE